MDKKMTDDYNLPEIAKSLASRLQKQRDKWITAFYQALHDFQPICEQYKLSMEAALPIVSAFQIVHVMSFIHTNEYIREQQIGDFITPLTESLYGHPTDDWMKYVKQYQTNKQKDLSEQVCRLSEDVAMAIMESHAGMLYGPGFAVMAMEFLYRNWGIVADHFGDTVKVEECAKAVKSIHTGSNK
ncbi:MAG: hypothetical protein Q8M34_02560 [Thermodesulfovibrionales bacterium]|nr:hypothetical protein [Thermodesulfovibrionales bacterium]